MTPADQSSIALQQQSSAGTHSAQLNTSAMSSILDRQKMLEQCDKEVSVIEYEFSLLERQDFIEIVS